MATSQTTLAIKDGAGASKSLAITDSTAGSGPLIANNVICDQAGTHFLPTSDAAARALWAQITDATNTAAVKAASTAALATDPALVVAISPNLSTIVNLNKVNGTAISLGATTKSASLPVALATDTSNLQTLTPIAATPLLVAAQKTDASSNNQTLAGTSGKTTYLTGLTISGLGATAGSTILISSTGLTNQLKIAYTVPAGATVAAPTLNLKFDPPIPATGTNTAIVILVPSFGTGNVNACAQATGFQV